MLLYPLIHSQYGQGLGALGSFAGDDVEDGIGAAGALDVRVDEVMSIFGAVSRGDFGGAGVGAYDAKGGRGE